LPHAGAVVELGEAAATALGQAVATNLAIAVPGATWVYPQRIASARAGTSITVLARLAQPATTFEVIAGGEHHTVTALPGSTALIERAAAAGELAALEAQLATAKGDTLALRRTIAAKSVAARVLSTETSLLVLESDADYARYGIARGTDVLVVDANAVTRKRRGAVAVVASKSPIEPPTADDGHGIPLPEPKADYGPDNDHDGIPDAVDRCPDEPETYNGLEDADGCPDRGRLVISSSQIIILQAIHFTANGATLMRESLPILDAVATVLIQNPDIERIEIGGHTDERGDDATNLALSDRRATAVMQYLVGKGVAPARLEAKGYGETRPLDPAHTELAWAKNRRVEFLILRRANTEVAAPATPTAKPQPPPPPPAVTGELAAIEAAIAAHDLDGGLARARTWHDREPGNVLALVGLGEVLEARRATATAARMYGSIIDLYPARADLRRFAGERLARLAPDLAIDTFRRAVADRPDHMTGHRLLAYALERAGRHADAFTAILAGVDQPYRDGSYRGGLRVLGDDAAMLGAVYAAAVPAQRGAIVEALAKRKLALATQPSTRFVLYWETDGNDVDLHVEDARGGHAFYQQPELASGGELYADITTGYGPECFTIPGTPTAGPYRLSVDYYRQGPMGFGMGMVEIQRFDPRRGLSFDDRHYVIMNDHARADVGVVR
jgi:outer membrane protein OmpA-like peptidoglycan-associated protein